MRSHRNPLCSAETRSPDRETQPLREGIRGWGRFAFAIVLLLLGGVFLPVVGSVASATLLPEWRWDTVPFHTAIETVGGFIALALAGILLASRRCCDGREHHLWMSAALIGMGILDLAHAVVAPGETFVWLHSAATFVGGVLFFLVWLPARIADSLWGRLVVPLTAIVTLAACAFSFCYPRAILTMVEQGAFTSTARGLNMLGGLGFLGAAAWFLRRYRGSSKWKDYLFTCLCMLFGTAGILFDLSILWDAAWWWWHLLRLAAYCLALSYFVTAYHGMNKQLNRDITERKQAEEELEEVMQRQVELNRLQQALLGPGDLAEKLTRITDGVMDTFNADFCRIWITKPGDSCESGCIHASVTDGPHVCRYRDRCLNLMASSGRYTHIDGEVHRRVPFGCYKIGRIAAEQDHKFLTNEAATDPRVHNHDWVKELGLVSFAGYQLRPPGGQTIGVLALFSKHAVTPEDDALLESLGTTTAQIIQMDEAGERLRESEARHRAITDAAQDALITADAEGNIRFWNPAAENIFGFSAAEAVGRNMMDIIVPPQYHEAKRKGMAVFGRTGSGAAIGKTLELTALRKDGSGFPIEISLSGYRDRGGFVAVALVRNITERKQAAMELEAAMEQLEAANQVAEDANQAKSEFLANMSHEIRTPMTAILGFSENLLDPDLSQSDRLNAIHTVHRNGEYLLGIINDILDLSKIEAGKMSVERIACSPCQLIAEVSSLVQVRTQAKGLPFNIEYIGAIPETIQTDPTRLRQILINLIGNAIKFTEVGGVRLVVRLTIGDCGLGIPQEKQNRQLPMLQFDVVDTGVGMSTEQIAKLFQPFTQADTSTTRKFGGTGLGLTISKRFTEMLDGDITIDSKPGEGSTFRVTIATGPLDGVKMIDNPAEADGLEPASQPERAKASPAKLYCRVLLAEDGPDNQRLISFVLKKAGAEVTVVENGKLAADAALAARDEGNPFDVILMDMQMPVMDGYEATGLLRQKGYNGPIIALTAHAMATDREKCINAGCDDYAAKPINRVALIGVVAEWVEKARQENELQAAGTTI